MLWAVVRIASSITLWNLIELTVDAIIFYEMQQHTFCLETIGIYLELFQILGISLVAVLTWFYVVCSVEETENSALIPDFMLY